VRVDVRAGGRGGDRADCGQTDRTADLAAGVDETGCDPGVRRADAGQASDRGGDEGGSQADAAEQEGGEEIPEVVSVDPYAAEQRSREGESEKPTRQHGADADPADDRLGDIGGDDGGDGQGGKGSARLDGREAEDVLHVHGEQEELRERTRSDDGHCRVRRRERAQAEDPQRKQWRP